MSTIIVNPGQSIQTAINSAVAGDTIYVNGPGTYTGTVTLTRSGTSSAQISIIGINNPTLSGTGNGFYIQNQEYYTIQGFTIQGYSSPIYLEAPKTGKSGIKILNNIINGGSTGITATGTGGTATDNYFRNLIIDGNEIYNINGGLYVAAIDFPDYGYNTGLVISNNYVHDTPGTNGINYGTNGGLIENNTLKNIGYNGLTTFKSQNQIIRNNIFDNIPNRQGGIRYDYGAGSNSIIEKNTFTNNAGIQLYPDSTNITLRNNIFQGGKEIQIEGGNNNKILNNTFGAGAARLEYLGISTNSGGLIQGNRFDNSLGLRLGDGISDLLITGNIFVNNPGSGILKSTVTTGTQTNITIENNVFYNNRANDISFTGGTVTTVNIKNNIFMNGIGYAVYRTVGTGYTASYNDTYGKTNTYSSGVTISNNISSNPQFASITSGSEDFHLKSLYGRYDPTTKTWVKDTVHSPCIDAGDPLDDYSSEPENVGGRIDMGAYGNTSEASYMYAMTACPPLIAIINFAT